MHVSYTDYKDIKYNIQSAHNQKSLNMKIKIYNYDYKITMN
jgi:hypothetical protein